MKTQFIFTGIFVALFALFSIPAHAQFPPPQQDAPQIEVSDEELGLFLDAAMSAQQVQADAQEKMVAEVEESGIDVETYNEIMQAEHMGESAEDLGISAEQMEAFESAFEKIEEIEEEMMADLTDAVEDEGMEMARFQEINMAIQQDPGLQQRLQELIQEAQPQQR